MSLLVDLFGYLAIILHGLAIVSQSMALGARSSWLAARPFAASLGADIVRRTAGIAAASAVALVLVEAVNIALQTAVLTTTIDLSVGNALGADYAVAGLLKAAAAGVLAVLLWRDAATVPLLPCASWSWRRRR
ncbi:MAG: hypothetical protein WDN04_11650 [Rhodospirillales bacterium]